MRDFFNVSRYYSSQGCIILWLNGSQQKLLLEVDDQLLVLLVFRCCFLGELSQRGVKSSPAVPDILIEEADNFLVRERMLANLAT